MEKEIQKGRVCALKLHPESSSAIQYGAEVYGKVLGRDTIDASKGTLDNLYPDNTNLTCIVVEDQAGLIWNVPERDVNKIVCGDEELC